jgi:general stress protein 26
MELDEVTAEATRLSPWAHLATVGSDGKPDVAPVYPAWKDGAVWIMSFVDTVKVRNIRANSDVAMHWQVDESGDGVAVWGVATVHTDADTKHRLWTGVFDYELDEFAPGGRDSESVCFVAVTPERALALKHYGLAGRDTWHR